METVISLIIVTTYFVSIGWLASRPEKEVTRTLEEQKQHVRDLHIRLLGDRVKYPTSNHTVLIYQILREEARLELIEE